MTDFNGVYCKYDFFDREKIKINAKVQILINITSKLIVN